LKKLKDLVAHYTLLKQNIPPLNGAQVSINGKSLDINLTCQFTYNGLLFLNGLPSLFVSCFLYINDFREEYLEIQKCN